VSWSIILFYKFNYLHKLYIKKHGIKFAFEFEPCMAKVNQYLASALPCDKADQMEQKVLC